MKLGAEQVVPANRSGHRPTIVGGREDIVGIRAHHMVGVDEIGVSAIIEALKNGMAGFCKCEFVPTHMGYFESSIYRFDGIDFACQPSKAIGDTVLQAAGRHKLHANTNSEERPATLADGTVNGARHSIYGSQTALAICKGTYARQDDTIGRSHLIGRPPLNVILGAPLAEVRR